MAYFSAQHIEKQFSTIGQTRPVLVDACFAAQQGELVTLFGPSGSGKSTLLNICGLIEYADKGQVVCQGQAINQLNRAQQTQYRRHHIGFIFQQFNLVPVMSVADNVALPLMLLNVPLAERRQRVAKLLEQVGLSEFANSRPEQLSGGQCQRVAIARALVKKPALIIADEPTASLDADTATTVLALLQQLVKEEGTTCLVATHDTRLLAYADQTLRVDHGVIKPLANQPQQAVA